MKRSRSNSIRRTPSTLTSVKSLRDSLPRTRPINHEELRLLFISYRYEISNCLLKLYNNSVILSWNMGSTSKALIFRLLNNKLGGNQAMSYNGWTNYETWNVALYMDNDEESYKIALSSKDYEEYRRKQNLRGEPLTGDYVSLFHDSLNIKELDEKITEMKA